MAVFRFLASLFLLVAVIALVADATPLLSGTGPVAITGLGEHWAEIAPTTYKAAEAAVTGWSPQLWTSLCLPVLAVPTALLFGGLAIVSGYAGRRRHRVKVFVN